MEIQEIKNFMKRCNMEKQTLNEVMEEQGLKGIYNAICALEWLKYRFESVPSIINLIMQEHDDDKEKLLDEISAMSHYTEYLAKEMEAETAKAYKCYLCVKRERENGTEA